MADLERYRWTPAATDVPFVLGAVGASALAGPALVRLLTGLGRGESAARNLLTKMVAIGVLDARPSGRVTVYGLARSSMSRYREVEGTNDRPSWAGSFASLVYDVPEAQRSLRDRLQHEARSAGYGQLRPGVLIAADDRWPRMRIGTERFGDGAWLHRATLTPASLDEARRMARTAWNLDELARRYALATERCAAAPEHPAADWATLRLWRELYDVFFAAQLEDPHLPQELLPRDWPAARFATAQAALNRRVGTVLLPFLRAEADARDPVAGNEYYPPPWAE